jgi:heat shock protein HtpX
MNYVRTAILLAALTALLMGLGYLLGGRGGALIAFLVAVATNFFAYWNGDRLVLSTQGAQEVDEHTAPELVHLVAELADRAGLPMPRVYLMACRSRGDNRTARHALARRGGGGDGP